MLLVNLLIWYQCAHLIGCSIWVMYLSKFRSLEFLWIFTCFYLDCCFGANGMNAVTQSSLLNCCQIWNTDTSKMKVKDGINDKPDCRYRQYVLLWVAVHSRWYFSKHLHTFVSGFTFTIFWMQILLLHCMLWCLMQRRLICICFICKICFMMNASCSQW